jgi:F0F1-type ATP synthase membrane subunit c/vacuolar-type H+-ATPase subunit K
MPLIPQFLMWIGFIIATLFGAFMLGLAVLGCAIGFGKIAQRSHEHDRERRSGPIFRHPLA